MRVTRCLKDVTYGRVTSLRYKLTHYPEATFLTYKVTLLGCKVRLSYNYFYCKVVLSKTYYKKNSVVRIYTNLFKGKTIKTNFSKVKKKWLQVSNNGLRKPSSNLYSILISLSHCPKKFILTLTPNRKLKMRGLI